jgi:hypothetical protein
MEFCGLTYPGSLAAWRNFSRRWARFGGRWPGNRSVIGSTEIYDPGTDSWSYAGNLSVKRQGPSVTLLPNHRVLAVGGSDIVGNPFAAADVFMPAQLVWSETHHPNEVRDEHTTTLLQDGRVLIAGGSGVFGTTLSSAELFIP